MKDKWKPILAWAFLVTAALLIVYGSVNQWPIMKWEPSDKDDLASDWTPTNPPEIIGVYEFDAIRLFGGTGITHEPNGFPHLNHYTGVCFA